MISIVVCTRNRASLLPDALTKYESLRSPVDWELIFVDNNSTDNTKTVIESSALYGARLRYLFTERIGLGAARDHAWRNAKGDILCFTDDDCYPDETFLAAIFTVFSTNPTVAAIGGRILLYDKSDARVTIDERNDSTEIPPFQFLPAASFHGANIAVRRSALEAVDGFDPELGAGTNFPCEDIDLFARLTWSGYRLRFDPRPLVYHHHRRKAADLPNLHAAYDRGRGAYYAKFLLRKDTRLAYFRGWADVVRNSRGGASPKRVIREIKSAFRYCIHRRAGISFIFVFFASIYILLLSIVTNVGRFKLARR